MLTLAWPLVRSAAIIAGVGRWCVLRLSSIHALAAPLPTALLKPALARCMASAAISCAKSRRIVVRTIRPFICYISLALTASVGAAVAEDDFPLTGNYTQNLPCKGDGSDPAKLQVKISAHEIDSKVGVCTILHTERDGKSVNAQLECQFAAGPMLGDVTFTMQPDGTVKMVDRDRNYRSVLYRCPQ